MIVELEDGTLLDPAHIESISKIKKCTPLDIPEIGIINMGDPYFYFDIIGISGEKYEIKNTSCLILKKKRNKIIQVKTENNEILRNDI